MKVKILVVDDDANICELLRLYLEKEGFEVIVAHNGSKAMEYFSNEKIDFVILDIMMPGDNGFAVCKHIRQTSKVPIIMLTAKGETEDKLTGFDAGADDYVCKPFNAKELVARIYAVLRRSGNIKEEDTSISFDNLKVDIKNYTLEVKGEVVDAPPKEIELLYYLASNKNKVFTRDQLLDKVWGFEFYGDTRTVDVHIKRIREKIEGASGQWSLKTVWSVGYKFEVTE